VNASNTLFLFLFRWNICKLVSKEKKGTFGSSWIDNLVAKVHGTTWACLAFAFFLSASKPLLNWSKPLLSISVSKYKHSTLHTENLDNCNGYLHAMHVQYNIYGRTEQIHFELWHDLLRNHFDQLLQNVALQNKITKELLYAKTKYILLAC